MKNVKTVNFSKPEEKCVHLTSNQKSVWYVQIDHYFVFQIGFFKSTIAL